MERQQVQSLISKLSGGTLLDRNEIGEVVNAVNAIHHEEPNVLRLNDCHVNVVGDIHGDLTSLNHIFNAAPLNGDDHIWVFLGDYVDRGVFSVPIIEMLYCLKLYYPQRIYLLRGNHECRQVSEIYGLLDEVRIRYQDSVDEIFALLTNSFYELPLAAIINGNVLAVHAGISRHLNIIDDIEVINRFQEVPTEGLVTDLLWSDPSDQNGWTPSPRGASELFGEEQSTNFCQANNIRFIVRSHQWVQEGHQWTHNNQVLTIFSSSNYCLKCGNDGSILQLTPENTTNIVTYPSTIHPENTTGDTFTFPTNLIE
jgi:diadenosine tetraphosphatase ApaH/serine/threonine PP2A family protein phosphatase